MTMEMMMVTIIRWHLRDLMSKEGRLLTARQGPWSTWKQHRFHHDICAMICVHHCCSPHLFWPQPKKVVILQGFIQPRWMTSIQVAETNNKIDQIHVQRFWRSCPFIEPTGATIASQGTNISLYPSWGKAPTPMSFPCEPPIGFKWIQS